MGFFLKSIFLCEQTHGWIKETPPHQQLEKQQLAKIIQNHRKLEQNNI